MVLNLGTLLGLGCITLLADSTHDVIDAEEHLGTVYRCLDCLKLKPEVNEKC